MRLSEVLPFNAPTIEWQGDVAMIRLTFVDLHRTISTVVVQGDRLALEKLRAEIDRALGLR